MDRASVYRLVDVHYREYARDSINRLSFSLGSRANAEETVQEAYTRACTYWKSFDTNQTIEQWIGTILRNCIRDRQRDTIMQGMVVEDATPFLEPAVPDATDQLYVTEIKRVIDSKPKRDAHILRLYLLDGYTSKELSIVTDLSAEAIRKLVSRFKEEIVAAA